MTKLRELFRKDTPLNLFFRFQFIPLGYLCFALYFDLSNSDTSWFSHAGCVLVIYVLILSSRKKETFFNEEKEIVIAKLKEMANNFEELTGDPYPPEQMQAWEDHHVRLTEIEYGERISLVYKIEFRLAILGTFIWGFGDDIIVLLRQWIE